LGNTFFFYLPSALWMAVVGLAIKPLVYYFFGLYRRMWMYASTEEMKLILVAVTAASVLVSAAMVGLTTLRVFVGFPRAVLIIDWVLSLLAVGGLRFSLRLLAESRMAQSSQLNGRGRARAQKTLIVGAGDAGAMVVRELH
jgi:FlaA1/EpsC-like NDP-sugar epimerase